MSSKLHTNYLSVPLLQNTKPISRPVLKLKLLKRGKCLCGFARYLCLVLTCASSHVTSTPSPSKTRVQLSAWSEVLLVACATCCDYYAYVFDKCYSVEVYSLQSRREIRRLWVLQTSKHTHCTVNGQRLTHLVLYKCLHHVHLVHHSIKHGQFLTL